MLAEEDYWHLEGRRLCDAFAARLARHRYDRSPLVLRVADVACTLRKAEVYTAVAVVTRMHDLMLQLVVQLRRRGNRGITISKAMEEMHNSARIISEFVF